MCTHTYPWCEIISMQSSACTHPPWKRRMKNRMKIGKNEIRKMIRIESNIPQKIALKIISNAKNLMHSMGRNEEYSPNSNPILKISRGVLTSRNKIV